MGRPLQRQQENDEHQNHQLPINILGLSLVCATPMLLGFLYGYDIGATSFVLQLLLEESLASESDYSWWSSGNLSSLQQGLFVSAVSLGALIASHSLTLHQFKSMGRRMELRLSASLYLIGTLINVVGSGILLRSSSQGFLALLLGRTLFGVGVGFVMHG